MLYWGYVKEAVHVQPLPATLVDLWNRVTTAVHSMTKMHFFIHIGVDSIYIIYSKKSNYAEQIIKNQSKIYRYRYVHTRN